MEEAKSPDVTVVTDQLQKRIKLLALDVSQDNARDLLQILDETGWRETRQELILILGRFLKFERVFYRFARLMNPERDLQESVWILEAFRNSHTNRYDTYLTNVFLISQNKIIQRTALESLIQLRSPLTWNIFLYLFNQRDLSLTKINQGTHFDSLERDILVLFIKYVGLFHEIRFLDAIKHLAQSSDPIIAELASVSAFRLGHGESSQSENLLRRDFQRILVKSHVLLLAADLNQLLEQIFRAEEVEIKLDLIQTLRIFPVEKVLLALESHLNEGEFIDITRILLSLVQVNKAKVIEFCDKHLVSRTDSGLAHGLNVLIAANKKLTGEQLKRMDRSNPQTVKNFWKALIIGPNRTFLDVILNDHFHNCENKLEKFEIINFVVLNYYLNPLLRDEIETFFDNSIAAISSGSTKTLDLDLRILRACGQIGYSAKGYLSCVELYVKSEVLSPSQLNGLISSFSNLPTEACTRLFELVLVKKALNSYSKQVLMRSMAQSQVDMGRISVERLLALASDSESRADVLILFFSKPIQKIEMWLKHLTQAQLDPSLTYIEKKWFIKVLSKLEASRFFTFLTAQLRSDDPVLAGLAVHSLCQIKEDRVVMELLRSCRGFLALGQEDFVLKIFREVEIPQKGRPNAVELVENLLPLKISDQLKERILSYLSWLNEDRIIAEKTGLIESEVSRQLRHKLRCFDQLSPTVKSVLLNAEMPTTHPEIFTEAVDKSTSILQYIKSIDIQLKEFLGAQIRKSSVLSQMQNVILSTGLDQIFQIANSGLMARANMGPYVAGLLRLEHIQPQQLPLGKLRGLIEAVTHGRLREDNLKSVDGINAWGTFLLVFGRDWHAGTNTRVLRIEKISANLEIEKFVSKLFELNDYRNPVAHRHTLAETVPIEQVRKRTFSVISEMCDIQSILERKPA